ncbi:14541_t:CDS:2, partial [Gigaspora rosea]
FENENEWMKNSQAGNLIDQHEVLTPNKEIPTENNEQVLVAQHWKQVQGTSIVDTKVDMIDEVGEGFTQKEDLTAESMSMEQDKHEEVTEEVTQAETNNGTTKKVGIDLEVTTQISMNEKQETTYVRDG